MARRALLTLVIVVVGSAPALVDTVVVTETGVENFTDFLPSELHDIEKLVREKGVVQTTPPARR